MTNERRSILLKFVLFYAVGIGLAVFIFSAYTTKASPIKAQDNYAPLFSSNEELNKDLIKLYQLNEQYLTKFSFPLSASTRDSILTVQAKIINPMKQAITKVVAEGSKYDEATRSRYATTAAFHENALKNWQTVNTFILFESGTAPVPATPRNLPQDNSNNQLRAKDAEIASLEKKLKAAQQKVNPNTATLQKNEEEIKFLKWAVRSQVTTIKSLESRLQNQ